MTVLLSNLGFILLPKEQGSWSLALEPVALALLVAPSAAGALLAVAVIAGFLARRPFKLAVTGTSGDPRRSSAGCWTAFLAAILLTVFAGIIFADQWRALWPLFFALPFGAAFVWFDLRQAMRAAEAELAGTIAFAVLPATFATLAGWPMPSALALAGLALARSVPTVLAIRAYLRRQKGQTHQGSAALIGATLALAVVILLAGHHLVPWIAPGLVLLLLVRTVFLASPLCPAWTARQVGIMEAVGGGLYIAVLALAFCSSNGIRPGP